METNDFEVFRTRLMAAGELYDKKVSPALLDMYWQALRGLSLDEFSQGMNAHAVDPKHGTFWPKPADIVRGIQASMPSTEDKAQLAWSQIMGEISRVGAYGALQIEDAQAMAAVEAMGGWPSICATHTDKMEWKRKEFFSVYATYERTPIDQLPAKLPGRIEIQNHKLASGKGGGLTSIADTAKRMGMKQITNDDGL